MTSEPENCQKGWRISNWLRSVKEFAGRALVSRDSLNQVNLVVDADIMEFIMTSQLRTDFRSTLSQHQSGFNWKSGSSTAVLMYRGQVINEEAWDYSVCMDAVYSYMTQFTKFDIRVENEFWRAVLNNLPNILATLSELSPLQLEEIASVKAIRLICRKSEFENLKNKLQDDLEEIKNSEVTKKQLVPCHSHVRKFLVKQRKCEIGSIENELKQFRIKVENSESEKDFVITGRTEGLASAQEMLEVLTKENIFTEPAVTIQQHGLIKLLADGRGQTIVQLVEREHECAIEVQHNFTSELESPTADMPENFDSDQESDDDLELDEEVRATVDDSVSIVAVGNCRITCNAEDITKEQADSLVNSEDLYAKAMTEVTDPNLEMQAYTTATGVNLACSHVMNTRCWNYDGRKGTANEVLKSAVKMSLVDAICLQKSSVTFNVIGTGEHGFPPDVAVRTMLEESIQFCEANRNGPITEIHLVVFIEVQALMLEFKQEMAAMQRKYYREANITICVKQGDIIQEQTDAIVNINSVDMDMNHAGALSKAVAKASGRAVKKECKNAGKQEPGAAVITSGGNLAVQHIIHSVPGSSDKLHLQQCVESCLKLADNAGLRSVSLPGFGTGAYGMTAQYSAELMFQALENFSPTSQNVREVNIVIFQQEMLGTFAEEQQRRNVGLPSPIKTHPPASFPRSSASKVSREKRVKKVTPVNTSENGQIVTFCVVGKDRENTNKAIEALTKGFSAAYKVEKVEDKAIQLLTERDIDHLLRRATSLDVSLSVESTMDQIIIRGNSDDVLTLVQEIWAKLNIRKGTEIAKLMSKTVQWQYTALDVKKCFDEESNLELEMAYANDQMTAIVPVLGEKYSVILPDKIGTGQSTGNHITVNREVVGAGPKGIALPTHWIPVPVDTQTGNDVTVHLVPLLRSSQEYDEVMQKFQDTGGNVRISSIHRVQNPHLYKAYMMTKQKMDEDNGRQNNERQLFHGTAAENVAKINTQGFNRSFAGTHGKAHGAGVYFARDASYSKRYAYGNAGSKHMYIARVLVGQYVRGNSSMMVPPPKNASRPEITYDSTVDDLSNPSIFVVFHDNQCYPEYLIRF